MHLEIHASQPQALIDYYTALLGWTITKWEGAEGFDDGNILGVMQPDTSAG
jgi:predicted enzyme related to lactoylglutathione lyase